MKRYNIADLKQTIMESCTTRSNILTMLESTETPKPYVVGKWKAYKVTLPDGIELVTKYGVKMAGEGLPVKVYNENGQYRVEAPGPNGDRDVELAYILTECDQRISSFVVFD